MESMIATLAQVLGRLGAGKTLRLRRSGPDAAVEVHARSDGALEVPAALLVTGEEDGAGPGGPHVLYGRHRTEELAAQLVTAIGDLELVTSSVVDASGVERLLDGAGARSDVTVDGLLDRWDLPLIEQVRRYLAQRFTVSLNELVPRWAGAIVLSLGRVPHLVEALDDPPRIHVSAVIVQGIAGSDELDLALHRGSEGGELVRLRHHWDTVRAEVVLPAPTFMGQHLDLAFREIARVSAAADKIAAEFGGTPSHRIHPRPRPSELIDPDAEQHDTEHDPQPDDSKEDDR